MVEIHESSYHERVNVKDEVLEKGPCVCARKSGSEITRPTRFWSKYNLFRLVG